MTITSRANPLVVATAALQEKKYREENRRFLLEGMKLFREAVSSGIAITSVFALPSAVQACRAILPEGELYEVSEAVLDKLSTEKSPDGVICTAKYLDKIHIIKKIYKEEDFTKDKKRLFLSSIRDPGNLGTILRSAAAFGIDEVTVSDDCADLYHPRTVRAAMGTLFRIPVCRTPDLAGTVALASKKGYRVYAAVLDDKAERLDSLAVDRRTAFIIGNEGHGVSPEVVKAAGRTAYIPMAEGVESLNASAAAAIFLFQMR